MKKTVTNFFKGVLLTILLVNSTSLISQTHQPTPNLSFPTTNGVVNAMVWDSINDRLYIGGSFSSVGGSLRQKFAVLKASTGALQTWSITCNGDIQSMHLYNGMLYIGGGFTTIAGQSRAGVAKFKVSSQTIASWNPALSSTVYDFEHDGGFIYCAGTFGGARANLCRVDTAAGSVDMTWNANINSGVMSIDKHGTDLYCGGFFTSAGGQTRNYLAVFNNFNTSPSVDLNWDPSPDNYVYALKFFNNQLYVTGRFASIGGALKDYFAELNPSGTVGDATSLDIKLNNNSGGNSIEAKGNSLFVGGYFSNVSFSSTIYNVYYLFEYDVKKQTITKWNGYDTNVLTGSLSCITLGNNTVYVGQGSGSHNPAAFCANFYSPIDYDIDFVTPYQSDVCFHQKTALTYTVSDNGSGANSYNWSNSSAGITVQAPTTSSSVSMSYSNAAIGTNITSVYGTNGCINTNTVTTNVNVYQLSVKIVAESVAYDTSYNGSITCGSQDIFQPSASYLGLGTLSYTWAPSATLSSANTYSVSSNAKTNTLYTLTTVSSDGCSSKDTMTLFVTPYNVYANNYSSTILCGTGDSLYATTNYPGFGTVTYTWSPSLSVSLPHAATTAAHPVATTNYKVTSTSSDGCFANAQTIAITVNPITVNAGATLTNITCGDAIQLSETDDYPGNGIVTYTWSPAAGISNTHTATPTAKPITFTTYTLIAKTPEGCTDTSNISIDVNPISVTATANASNITCGDPVQLGQSNNYNGTGTLSYSWTPSTALSSTSVSTPTANPINNITYAVTVISSEGCQGSNNVSINVDALQINTAGSYSIACHSPVNLTTSSNSSNSNLTYSWTPSTGLSSTTVASPNAAVFHNTTYNVTMSLPNSGCQSSSNSVSVNLTIPATPQICMVSVDTTGAYNIVYWDKTGYAGTSIDSFRIYRETGTNTYAQIGSVSYNSLSEFNDYGVNPNLTTYRYKLSAVDSCGNESALSNYHNTILILYVGSGQFSWNPGYSIENNTTPVTNYLLMRDDNNTGNFQQIGSTTGNQFTLVDPNYATYQNTANWRVDATGFNCNPSLRLANGNNSTYAAKVKSHSNQNNNRQTTGAGKLSDGNSISVYPNPATNLVNISFEKLTNKATIKITNLLGEEVYTSNQNVASNNLVLDISKFESGTYLIQITTENITEIKRIVKQ